MNIIVNNNLNNKHVFIFDSVFPDSASQLSVQSVDRA